MCELALYMFFSDLRNTDPYQCPCCVRVESLPPVVGLWEQWASGGFAALGLFSASVMIHSGSYDY